MHHSVFWSLGRDSIFVVLFIFSFSDVLVWVIRSCYFNEQQRNQKRAALSREIFFEGDGACFWGIGVEAYHLFPYAFS